MWRTVSSADRQAMSLLSPAIDVPLSPILPSTTPRPITMYTDIDMLKSPMGPQMKDLYDAIWKEGKPFVTNESGVDILVDTLGAIAPQPLVMVRSEYPQIFQHILDLPTWSETHAGLVVTGHPGVGKTLFLYYALGAALAAHMPVALYERDSLCLFFDDSGVHKIHDIGATEFPPRTLFLVDSNSSLHSPPGAFLDHRLQGVIVQATSPDASRWRSWAKEVGASYWLSAPWKREEILALQRVTEALGRPGWVNPSPGSAVYTPVEVFDLLGPSPRTCMRMAGRVKSQDGPLVDFADYLALPALMSDLETVLRTVSSRQAPPDCYYGDNNVDHVFFLYNARGSNPNYDDAPQFCYAHGVPAPPGLHICQRPLVRGAALPAARARHPPGCVGSAHLPRRRPGWGPVQQLPHRTQPLPPRNPLALRL
ncbi:hypothetical protein LXA43DRAFT_1034721 [Ganoderma leucocontextum]|nr:hypothetical protein LXA43DRAFT_1034721 [Ganoderma leucocontextum]